MAKRINRVIELIESKEPVYYTSAGDLPYENGLKQASTWADFLIPEFELLDIPWFFILIILIIFFSWILSSPNIKNHSLF